MVLGETFLHIKCVFLFSLQSLSETFHIVRRIELDIVINVHRACYIVPVIRVGFS